MRIGFILLIMSFLIPNNTALFPDLKQYCQSLEAEFDQIPAERKADLEKLSAYIRAKKNEGKPAKIVVICTHNSRRSHLGQVWLQTAAAWYDTEGLETFSGGTEATALNPRAAAAMARAGFRIEKTEEKMSETNPVYELQFAKDGRLMRLFSKRYSDSANPQSGFFALPVCSDADRACPIVLGAEERLAVPYEDPKAFDGTGQETEKYDERCRQIAREMFYVMKKVKN